MSTPTVSAIAVALASAVGTITGLRAVDYLSDTITPPVALVGVDTVNFHEAFGNSGDVLHDFTVYVIVGRASERAGLLLMEGYMSQSGANSVRSAIEADTSLGGVVSSLKVVKCGPPNSVSVGGADYIAVPFAVEVHA